MSVECEGPRWSWQLAISRDKFAGKYVVNYNYPARESKSFQCPLPPTRQYFWQWAGGREISASEAPWIRFNKISRV